MGEFCDVEVRTFGGVVSVKVEWGSFVRFRCSCFCGFMFRGMPLCFLYYCQCLVCSWFILF